MNLIGKMIQFAGLVFLVSYVPSGLMLGVLLIMFGWSMTRKRRAD
jgi:uncharacterized membrane protein